VAVLARQTTRRCFCQVRSLSGPRSEDCLLANANVFIVAGFDPLTSLTAVVHYMLVDRGQYRRLTDEVRGAFSAYDPITNQELQSLRCLYSVLEEGLRLHTPAAFGLPRISPGAMVDGRWIPRGVGSPPISLLPNKNQLTLSPPSLPDNGTDSLLLHDTLAAVLLSSAGFHPERWLPSTHVLYDANFASDSRSAFRPFGMGPRGCIGKAVGYMQARVVLAKLVWYLDCELLNGDEIDWERDNTLSAIWVRPSVWIRYKPSGNEMGT
jgi:cytochrome P450